jgi:hypothetical protein
LTKWYVSYQLIYTNMKNILPAFLLNLLVLLFSNHFIANASDDEYPSSLPGNSNDARTAQPVPEPQGLKLALIDLDITPPIGYHMAFNPVINTWDMGLRAKGLILLGAGQPVVICAFDWHSIANAGQDVFKKALADAAGTIPERVEIHTLHQHDAPMCDFSAEKILREAGLDPDIFNGDFPREVIHNLEIAIRNSIKQAQPVTHIGSGEAKVFQVASNRRILGKDGKVRASRSSSSTDSLLRAEPEGLIDPTLSLISFWNNDKPLAVVSFYATHPQSYYRTGIPNPDFPGIARFLRQLEVPQALHIHFNGASGNVAAGKYNDGSRENRLILAQRLADGMARAWKATKREPVTAESVKWDIEPVALPPSDKLDKLQADLRANKSLLAKDRNAQKLAWLERCQEGRKINITCLSIGKARILFLPGEMFVEYQLAAKAERPDLFVTMAAYGDFGPHYVGTAAAYDQGGYEIGASDVSPGVEKVIRSAMHNLLNRK